MSELFETLADIEHQRWSDWTRYQFSRCQENKDGSLIIPAELVEHWTRQTETDYVDLTPAEQASDKEQVHRYWSLIEIQLTAKDEQLKVAQDRVAELEKIGLYIVDAYEGLNNDTIDKELETQITGMSEALDPTDKE